MSNIRLNIGSARDRIEGFKNVDGLDWGGNTDYVWNIIETPYPIGDEMVEEIRSIETLEHISWRELDNVLSEWNRILEIGGKITIGVPDCGSMMEMYVNKEVCCCVKHKPKSEADTKAKPDCEYCKGKGKVNPIRWLMAFNGALKHKYDAHLNTFTKTTLRRALEKAGFKDIKFTNDKAKWKLKVKAKK